MSARDVEVVLVIARADVKVAEVEWREARS
jgi:hypothetical protein